MISLIDENTNEITQMLITIYTQQMMATVK